MTDTVPRRRELRKTRDLGDDHAVHADISSSDQQKEDETMSTDVSSEAPAAAGSPDDAVPPPVATPKIEISRDEEANRIISKYVGWGAGSGVIPVPLLDVAAIATVQVMMIRDLLALYERPFSESRARATVSVLIGSLSPSALAGVTALTVLKVVPVIGYPLATLSLPILASASTYAVGKVILAHLEEGGNLDTLDAKGVKTPLRNAFKEGKAKLKSAADRVLA